jgi:hypothetical protein
VYLDFLQVHDIGIFVMQIKQVDLVGQEASVKAAFFHHNGMKTI